jgi:hypothetical protein
MGITQGGLGEARGIGAASAQDEAAPPCGLLPGAPWPGREPPAGSLRYGQAAAARRELPQ